MLEWTKLLPIKTDDNLRYISGPYTIHVYSSLNLYFVVVNAEIDWVIEVNALDAAKHACETHAIEQVTKRLLGEK